MTADERRAIVGLNLAEGEAELKRSLRLLLWWDGLPAEPFVGASMANGFWAGHRVILEFQSAYQSANLAQADAMSALARDIVKLLLVAAKAQSPQALLRTQLEVVVRMRRCASECARVWADVELPNEQTYREASVRSQSAASKSDEGNTAPIENGRYSGVGETDHA